RSGLSNYFSDRKLVFVFGAMRDKAIGEMAEILFPLAERVIAAPADNPRSASASEIRAAAARTTVQIEEATNVAAPLERAREAGGENSVVVVPGSIYIVGEAVRRLGVSA